jgi:hypothetical protein
METDFSLVKSSKNIKKSVVNKTDNETNVQYSYKYSLDDFNKFRQNMKIQIPQVIINKIKIIYNETIKSKMEYLNSKSNTISQHHSSTSNTTNISRDLFNNAPSKRKHKAKELSDEDWEAMRNFKITQKDKKDGIDKIYDELRNLLNKITDETYDYIKRELFSTIDNFVNNTVYSYGDFGIIIQFIFNIVMNNSFYSKLYSELLISILYKKELEVWFENNYESLFSTLFGVKYKVNDIVCCDPDEDYEKYCQVNKINEQRRNLAIFFSNLMLGGIGHDNMTFTLESGLNYMEKYYKLFSNYANDEDMQEQCYEACEILCILYKNLHEFYSDESIYGDVVVNIRSKFKILTIMKRSDMKIYYPGITAKTMFKIMDLELN